LGQIDPPTEPQALRAYDSNLRDVAQRHHVYAKVSAVLRRVNGRVPQDLNFYRSRLDEMWGIFGQNRLIYGSDWPNSDLSAPYSQVLSLVRQYFDAKGTVAVEDFFWKNSAAAYRWVRREHAQPNPDEA
jgi:L-fuconolactonase